MNRLPLLAEVGTAVTAVLIALLSPVAAQTLEEATDIPIVSLNTGGTQVWFGQTATTHDGSDAAESGNISNNQTTWMETSVTGPETIIFWWRVSSEAGFDYLRFRVDGNVEEQIAGDSEWIEVTYDIAPGSHVLRWSYEKDFSVSTGSDRGWVDEINLSSNNPLPTIISPSQVSGIVNLPLTYFIVATKDPTSYGATNLPTGFSINTNTGEITGTPTTTGSLTFTVTATNADGMGSKQVTFEVGSIPWPEVNLSSSPVITGLTKPVAITHAGDGTGRLFITQQAGTIRLWKNNTLSNFLNINSRVRSNGNEEGLLSTAFPPDFATSKNPNFYVYYTRNASGGGSESVISRFNLTANPDLADPNSEEILLTIPQPFSNHNGGQINFGPNGYLYIATGDGGSGGDPGNRAQNPMDLLGKMLRIDVQSPPDPGLAYKVPADNPFIADKQVRPEIWALGLRNPWRWSFDRETNDIYIGDVGQNAYEEIDFTPAPDAGGKNYQWRRLEGFNTYSGATALTKGTSTDPIYEHPQSVDGDFSITGGYVYRGEGYPRMQGVYIYGDYESGRIYGLQRNVGNTWVRRELEDTSYDISCFGEDEAGELYLADHGGGDIYAIAGTRDQSYLELLNSERQPNGDLAFTIGCESGAYYQAQQSIDLVSWINLGPPQLSTGSSIEFVVPSADLPEPTGLFRARALVP